jgi:hypothetical protein
MALMAPSLTHNGDRLELPSAVIWAAVKRRRIANTTERLAAAYIALGLVPKPLDIPKVRR